MATQITADLPTLDFPREVDYPTQEDWAAFSAAAEENFGILGGDWSTQMQLWKTEANAMSTELNTNATIAQGLANYQGDWVSQGYTLNQTVSIGEVYYICKLTHATGQNPTDSGSLYWNLALGNWNLKADKTEVASKLDKDFSAFTDKTTPIDTDVFPIMETSGLIKKLSWSNIKATLKTYFDTLYFSKTSGNLKLGMDNLLHIQDQKTNGTNGGASSTSFANITLNTILINNVGATLNASQITLQAGNYFIEAIVPYYSGSSSPSSTKIKLFNESDSTDSVIGLSGIVDEMNTYQNILSGEFSIASPKNFTIKHRCSIGGGNIGYANSFSLIEIYSDVKIWKVG